MNIVSTRKIPEFPFEIYKYGKKRCPINHPASVFRKSAILFAGGYRHFPLFEDYYLWVRLLLMVLNFTIFKSHYCFFAHLQMCLNVEVD